MIATGFDVPPWLEWLGTGLTWGLPNSLFVSIPLATLIILTLRYTGFSRLLYAVGDNEKASRLSGVQYWKVILASMCARASSRASPGCCSSTASLTPVDPQLLPAVAAAVIGGTSTFAERISNAVTLPTNGVTGEMARLMREIYNEETWGAYGRGWHQVFAMELGIMPEDFGTMPSWDYKLENGVYEDKSASFVGGIPTLNDAVASVLSGKVNGKATLMVTFKGSDAPADDPRDWLYDIFQARDLYYEKYKPLVDGIFRYLWENAGKYDQILVSGHSLGGAMVQQFIADLVQAGHGDKTRGYGFAPIGGETDILDGGTGSNTLTGGNGLDSFRFLLRDHAADAVTDFLAADDTLVFEDSSFDFNGASFGTRTATASTATDITGADLVIYTGSILNSVADAQAYLAAAAGGSVNEGVFIAGTNSGGQTVLFHASDASATSSSEIDFIATLGTLTAASALQLGDFTFT